MTSDHIVSRLPLRALQIFEAAARHQNFTAAGRDLGITQSAVSRKISELEAILGAQLFNRSGPNLSLTRTGRSLAHRVSYALNDLQAACLDARSSPDRGVVTLSMLPSVAAKWLAPRLGQFASLHPEIDLRISASHSLVDFAADGVDGAIRYGRGNWPGLEATWLGSETVQPVCSPAALKAFGISTPSDLLRAPLIHSDIPEDWATWFAAAGIGDVPVPRGPAFGDETAILQAAVAGQGFALGRSLLVADDLADGRLIAPFDIKLDASFSYWFVCPSGRSNEVSTVSDWIFQEFAKVAGQQPVQPRPPQGTRSKQRGPWIIHGRD